MKASTCKVAFVWRGGALSHACVIALPNGLICLVVKLLSLTGHGEMWDYIEDTWEVKTYAFGVFSSMLALFIVFRSSQAYSRYWEGCGLVKQMTGSFFDAASSLLSFTSMSKADAAEVLQFKQLIVSLTSLMNGVNFNEMSGMRETCAMEVIGWDDFDQETQLAVQTTERKAALVFFWWQSMIAVAIDHGVLNVPPPLIARTFAEVGDGMVAFENASKLTNTPFPFCYTQASIWLLMMHWVLTPLAVLKWTTRPSLAFVYSFLLVFAFWALFFISELLEEPFGDDETDINMAAMQRHFNENLYVLLTPEASRMPCFREGRDKGKCEMVARQAILVSSETGGSEDLQPSRGCPPLCPDDNGYTEACCCLVNVGGEDPVRHQT